MADKRSVCIVLNLKWYSLFHSRFILPVNLFWNCCTATVATWWEIKYVVSIVLTVNMKDRNGVNKEQVKLKRMLLSVSDAR